MERSGTIAAVFHHKVYNKGARSRLIGGNAQPSPSEEGGIRVSYKFMLMRL